MNHHNQSNLAEIFNENFKAENLKIGKIALNAHYSVIPMEEVVSIYIIDDENNDDDTFAERFEKFNSHNGWVHLAAGMSLFVDNQHITIILLKRKYLETVAHFNQKDVIKLFGNPDRKEDDICDFYDAHFAFACYIWYYHDLQLSIWFDVDTTKQIEQIQIGGLNNLEEIEKRLNSEIALSFWDKIKFYFTGKLDFRQKETPKSKFPVLSKTIYELKQGKCYQVVKAFIDHDHQIHPVGETWIFDETNYVPYHSGLSLFVIQDGKRTQHRFQDLEEEQAELLRTFMDYVVLVKD